MIVAGFGRFGQVVVRVLRGLGIKATVIDHDPGQIETVRRFGFKAYYGDATRMDLLEAAGAARARLLVVAIDDAASGDAARYSACASASPACSWWCARAAAPTRTNTPRWASPRCARCSARRSTPPAAASRVLGYSEDEVVRILRRFREYDEAQISQQAPHRNDLKALIEIQQRGPARHRAAAELRKFTSAMPAAMSSAAAAKCALSGSDRNTTPDSMPNSGVRNESTLRRAAQ